MCFPGLAIVEADYYFDVRQIVAEASDQEVVDM